MAFNFGGGGGGSRDQENSTRRNDDVFQLWPPEQYYYYNQQQQQPCTGTSLYFKGCDEPSGGSPTAGMSCQDCGNQAKKDCSHARCRTCCKSRGFRCPTHVKSTWVPAAKRRERQHQLAVLEQPKRQEVQVCENEEGRDGKNCNPSIGIIRMAAASSSRSMNTGLQVARFPPEVTLPAVFRCMKVRTIDGSDEEYAYQTAVRIGGHLFKGILYDQGPTINNLPENHHRYLTTAGESLEDPSSSLYTTAAAQPLDAFLAGTQFFPPPRP